MMGIKGQESRDRVEALVRRERDFYAVMIGIG